MKTKEKTVVCYASDSNGFRNLEISAWSVRKFFGDDTEIYLLTDSYSIPGISGVKILSPIEALKNVGFFPNGWNRQWPFATLYRMAIPLMDEFKDVSRVIYLDNDTLIISDKTKEKLTSIDMEGFEMAGSPDVDWIQKRMGIIQREYINTNESEELRQKIWSKNDINSRKYCNGGVLVFNLDQIRKNGIDWYRKRLSWFWEGQLSGKWQFLDQDFVNSMMDMTVIDSKFNSVGGHDPDAYIHHYVGHERARFLPKAISLGYTTYAGACKDIIREPTDIGNSKQLILFVCHIINEEMIWRFRKLRTDVSNMNFDVIWCLDTTSETDKKLPDDIDVYKFNDSQVINSIYRCTGPSRVFSYGMYIPMTVAQEKPEYDYIWHIEYDACFSGNWADFFSEMNKCPHDLICHGLSKYSDNVRWSWNVWDLGEYSISKDMYKSYNQIARLSRKLCNDISVFCQNNISRRGVYFEPGWATIAVHTGSCLDISDKYISANNKSIGSLKKSMIYHAIKNDISWKNILSRNNMSTHAEETKKNSYRS